jgi:hypothetical protein
LELSDVPLRPRKEGERSVAFDEVIAPGSRQQIMIDGKIRGRSLSF